MNVLSVFDGMSCGMIALERAGINVEEYFSSEIDEYAIKVSQQNYPSIRRLGNVEKIEINKARGVTYISYDGGTQMLVGDVDLLIGGSPCQSFSIAGDGSGFDGSSKLFWEYIRVLRDLRTVNPDIKFLLENVVMKKEWEDVITKEMGISPILINSSLFSAQNRKRLYWTNIPIPQLPKDKGLVLADILKSKTSKKFVEDTDRNLRHERGYSDKALCCSATMYKGAGNNGMTLVRRINQPDNKLSVLTPEEVEALQTVPIGYTAHVSNTQRYKMLGNGWTVDVIAHIFEGLKR